MRLVAAGACTITLLLGCGGGSAGGPQPPADAPPAPAPPAAPSLPEPSPPEAASPPWARLDLGCAERLYTFPVGAPVEGVVPCPGEVCVESAPIGIGSGFVVGERGSLWVIADGVTGAGIPTFLRQDGERWVSVCPPPGARHVTAAHGGRGDDVWVAGYGGYIAHWDGLAWTQTPSPVAGTVTGIWGDAREAFASVTEGWPPRSAHGPLLRWDGSAWRDTGASGSSPRGNGAGGAWALGPDGVLEWNGAGWQPVSGIAAGAAVQDLWAPPGGDLWVLVNEPLEAAPRDAKARVLRRASGAFVDAGLPSSDGGHGWWIRGSSDADVWVATAVRDYRSPPRVARWDGSAWSEAPRGTRGSRGGPPHVLPDGEALVWAGGLQRLDGGLAVPATAMATASLDLVAAASAEGDVWLGGGSGLWRLEGRAFRSLAAPPTAPVLRIAARARDDVWAWTSSGDFLHWNGTGVEVIAGPQPEAGSRPSSVGIAPAGDGRAWTVAGTRDGSLRDCTLWRWDGGWSSLPIPGAFCPRVIAPGPDGEIWLAGGGTVLRRRADGTWRRQEVAAEWIEHLVVVGPDDAWAAGDGLHRWDGAAWRRVTPLLVYGLAVSGPDEVWLSARDRGTGASGLWRWDGVAWIAVPAGILPFGLAAAERGEVWGAGGGSVLHVRAARDR